MYCMKCGKEIDNDTKFCPFCGSAQGQAAQMQTRSVKPAAARKSNPTMKILLSMVAIFFVALILFLTFAAKRMKTGESGQEDMAASGEGAEGETLPFADGIKVGDIVTFGSYEQDGRLSNGSEPIEWDVLDEKDGRYLLISHYVLDVQQFDDGRTDTSLRADEDESSTFVTWETCSLRKWLNNEFYNTAFSATEQQYIVKVTNTTRDYDDMNENDIHNIKSPFKDSLFSPFKNADFTGKGGNPTQDNVFALSFDEFVEYYDVISDLRYGTGASSVDGFLALRSLVSPTQYAADQNVKYVFLEKEFGFDNPDLYEYYTENIEGYIHQDYRDDGRICNWVLRSPGEVGTTVMLVDCDMDCFEEWSMKSYFGIRPAIWVNY